MKPVVLGVLMLSAVLVVAGCERNLSGKAAQIVSDGDGGGGGQIEVQLGILSSYQTPDGLRYFNGADIYIDGQYKGKTRTNVTLLTGRYRIQVQTPHLTAYEQYVDVTSDNQEIVAQLEGTLPPRCVEDDSGNDIYTASVTVSPSRWYIYGDWCLWNGAGIEEAYCTPDGRITASNVYCPSRRCQNGACVR